jgi:hypothetical protein
MIISSYSYICFARDKEKGPRYYISSLYGLIQDPSLCSGPLRPPMGKPSDEGMNVLDDSLLQGVTLVSQGELLPLPYHNPPSATYPLMISPHTHSGTPYLEVS